MLKKIVFGTLLIGLIAILVIGVINRTVTKSSDTVESDGRGRGRVQELNTATFNGDGNQDNETFGYQASQGNRGQGKSAQEVQGGQQTGRGERLYPNYQDTPAEWLTVNGVVSQVPAAGVDLVIKSEEGEMVVGTGPLDLATEGLVLQDGDPVQVSGYWEGAEFKAAELTQTATGATIRLRDELGRPAWSGAGQNSLAQGQSVNSQGQLTNGQGDGRQGGNWDGEGRDSDLQAGVGQAQVETWDTLQGTVVDITDSLLQIQLINGELVLIENRPWWFVQEQGFLVTIGDVVTVSGFYEEKDLDMGAESVFEAGQITNLTTEQTVQIRLETGRPLWAGGRRG